MSNWVTNFELPMYIQIGYWDEDLIHREAYCPTENMIAGHIEFGELSWYWIEGNTFSHLSIMVKWTTTKTSWVIDIHYLLSSISIIINLYHTAGPGSICSSQEQFSVFAISEKTEDTNFRLSFLKKIGFLLQAVFTKKPKNIYFVNPDCIWLQTIQWKIR